MRMHRGHQRRGRWQFAGTEMVGVGGWFEFGFTVIVGSGILPLGGSLNISLSARIALSVLLALHVTVGDVYL